MTALRARLVLPLVSKSGEKHGLFSNTFVEPDVMECMCKTTDMVGRASVNRYVVHLALRWRDIESQAGRRLRPVYKATLKNLVE